MEHSKAPCAGCADRTIEPNCHTTCERYNVWKSELHKVTEHRKEFMIQLHDEEFSLRGTMLKPMGRGRRR